MRIEDVREEGRKEGRREEGKQKYNSNAEVVQSYLGTIYIDVCHSNRVDC